MPICVGARPRLSRGPGAGVSLPVHPAPWLFLCSWFIRRPVIVWWLRPVRWAMHIGRTPSLGRGRIAVEEGCVLYVVRLIRRCGLGDDSMAEDVLHRSVRGHSNRVLPVGLALVVRSAQGVGVPEGRRPASFRPLVVEGDEVVDFRGLCPSNASGHAA